MRKLILMGLTLTVGLAIAAVALAQSAAPTMTYESKVTPAKAGTKDKPKNGYLHSKFEINKESFSTLKRIEYKLPKTVKVSGKNFPKCSSDTVNQQGESACPKGSQVGTGASTALLGPQQQQLEFAVKVYANGANELTLSLTGFTNVAFPAKITGKGTKIGFDIPGNVQSPVPNLYTYVTSVTADLGHQAGIPAKVKKGGKNYYAVSVIGCKSKKQTTTATAFLADNPDPPSQPSVSASASSACKAA